MDIFSLVGKITINYADAVNNIEKVSKSAKDTAETLEDVDKKADGAGDSVEDAGQAAKNADSGFTTWKATLANLASTAITKVISGCTQLAEKMADVTKSAVGHYAEYEQLVGGVETLFKDSSGKLIDYAEKAYKTAGMSSNQYMNTATSFAASLIQGLGGDTAKAVELTNLAITDMSDNANKMGTDIGSIQDAYQGFAKQNYTMLDNLKLGYGGTQSEMIRLINDSGVLGEKIESLDNVTFDQMIEAIHKIQDNLCITGTTALITVDCDVEPYKIEINSASEPWLWDVFSFVNGIIHVNEVKVSGSKKVNLINRVKIVSPTFTCSTAMKVTHEGNTYSLPAGETTVYDIRLQEGDNYVTFTGNGTVKISYRGGSL